MPTENDVVVNDDTHDDLSNVDDQCLDVSQRQQMLGQRVWIAGLASIDDLRQSESFSSIQVDISNAFEYVRHITLKNEHISLNDAITMVLGLSKIMAQNWTRQIKSSSSSSPSSVETSPTRTLAHNHTFDHCCTNNISNISHCTINSNSTTRETTTINENANKRYSNNKRPKLQLDSSTKLTLKFSSKEEEIANRVKMIPDLALSIGRPPPTCTYPNCGTLWLKKSERKLSCKLAYLFTRNANVNKSKDKYRSLTCDSWNGKDDIDRMSCVKHHHQHQHQQQQHGDDMMADEDGEHHQNSTMQSVRSDLTYQFEDDTQQYELYRLDMAFDCIGSSEHYYQPPIRMLTQSFNANGDNDDAVAVDHHRHSFGTASIKSIMFTNATRKGKRTLLQSVNHQIPLDADYRMENIVQTLLPHLQYIVNIDSSRQVEPLVRAVSRGRNVSKRQAALTFAVMLELIDQNIFDQT